MENSITFTLFSDLHYKKGMYAASVEDLECIFDRAKLTNSEFVIHAGDLCNDYLNSKELTNACLNNKYSLPFYGVYGNHELESRNNSMEVVTPLLTNRTVHFGGENVGYYYFDQNGFRFVCLDTNYSLLNGEWVHNPTASFGMPSGATNSDSLGPTQLKWLEDTLFDALEKNLKCVTVSHAEFFEMPHRRPSSDAKAVREIFEKVNSIKKTVILALNGHYHTTHLNELNGIVYYDCNSVRNGYWKPMDEHHYTPDTTFDFQNYDKDGHPTEKIKKPLCELSQAKNTWFFTTPFSAVIKINGDSIEIEGCETEWMYGIVPPFIID